MHAMSSPPFTTREFRAGSSGWTEADLYHPDIERQWLAGRYEIINGVLSEMPAAFHAHGDAQMQLVLMLSNHFRRVGIDGRFTSEVDIVLDAERVVRADAAFVTPTQQRQQREMALEHGRRDFKKTRLYVPPLLVIESVSEGHERHDRVIKRQWYAEFGVAHYWIVDAYAQTLECLKREGDAYRVEAEGRDDAVLEPESFQKPRIELAELWLD